MHIQEKGVKGYRKWDEKILLVDDEDSNLRLLTQWLIPLGYDIELASNGEEAVRKVRDSKQYRDHTLYHDAGHGWLRGMQNIKRRPGDKEYTDHYGDGASRKGNKIKRALCFRK